MTVQPPGPDDVLARYYRGVVTRVYYGTGSGALRSRATDREYPFRGSTVEIRGPIPRIEGLREGMEVGFDLAMTGSGPVVSVIRVPE